MSDRYYPPRSKRSQSMSYSTTRTINNRSSSTATSSTSTSQSMTKRNNPINKRYHRGSATQTGTGSATSTTSRSSPYKRRDQQGNNHAYGRKKSSRSFSNSATTASITVKQAPHGILKKSSHPIYSSNNEGRHVVVSKLSRHLPTDSIVLTKDRLSSSNGRSDRGYGRY